MPYVRPNFKSKKALKEAIAKGERIPVWQMNNIFNVTFEPGETVYLEGPWYPEPHRWYGSCILDEDLCIKSVK